MFRWLNHVDPWLFNVYVLNLKLKLQILQMYRTPLLIVTKLEHVYIEMPTGLYR